MSGELVGGGNRAALDRLSSLRARLDAIDGVILEGMEQRFDTIREIAALKRSASIPMMQPGRVAFVTDRYGQFAAERGLSVVGFRLVAEKLIQMACNIEDEVISPELRISPLIATLGPAGTDHEVVAKRLSARFGFKETSLTFFRDVQEAIDLLSSGGHVIVILNAAHPDVDLVTTRLWQSGVRVAGAFMHDTQILVLACRSSVKSPRSIAIMPATRGYIDVNSWDALVEVPSKPLAGTALLEGQVDAAIVSASFFDTFKGELRLLETFGPVRCAWLAFTNSSEAETLIERSL